MSFDEYFKSISISASGLSAERQRMNVIAHNIANMHTTSTPEGGPYRRQYVIFEEAMNKALGIGDGSGDAFGGVSVSGLGVSDDPPKLVYDPSHPNAIQEGKNKGYVEMPDINPIYEMVDMITAQRAYEANVQAINSARNMIIKSLDIVK